MKSGPEQRRDRCDVEVRSTDGVALPGQIWHGSTGCWRLTHPVIGSNWDWDDVEGEESSGGTTWGGSYDFVGVWDGSEFTLTEPAANVPEGVERFQPGGTDCTDPALSETIDSLRSLDRDALGLGSRGSRTLDGDCVAFVEAYFDTPELRDALASIAAEVQVDLYFGPVND